MDQNSATTERIVPPRSWKDPDKHLEALLTHPYYRNLISVQHELHVAVMDYFAKNKFKFADLPVTTQSVSSPMGLGSDSLPVNVVINGHPTYLSDSMQFHLELACRITNQNTAYKMISFRGEQSDCTHLAQFQHAECEIIGDLFDIMRTAGNFLHHITLHLIEYCHDDVHSIAGTTSHLSKLLGFSGKFPSISMDEALEILLKQDPNLISNHPAGFSLPTKKGEKFLCDYCGCAGVLWIKNFPHNAVPFYQAFCNERRSHALNADLLVCGLETIGAGQRHFHSSEVIKALNNHKIAPEPYSWYVRMRDMSSIQTSGFGVGLERYLMWVLKQSDIRDCTLLTRENGSTCCP
jgi:asparaginyl-tRNA synthetase